MKTLLLATFTLLSGLASADISPQDFQRLHRELQPPAESWTTIPWQSSLIPDRRFLHQAPPGVRIVRVHAKVLGGFKPTDDKWLKIFQQSVSRDNLWITAKEEKALRETCSFPSSLIRRLALYHLVDNTRGEPTFWKEDDITIDKKGKLHGKIHLQRGDGSSSFDADLRGIISFNNGTLTRFDLVAHGGYTGGGKYTHKHPEGTFPLGISFRLVDGSSPFDQIPPQGAKSWWQHYLGQQ